MSFGLFGLKICLAGILRRKLELVAGQHLLNQLGLVLAYCHMQASSAVGGDRVGDVTLTHEELDDVRVAEPCGVVDACVTVDVLDVVAVDVVVVQNFHYVEAARGLKQGDLLAKATCQHQGR